MYTALCTVILAVCSQIIVPGAIPFTMQTFAAAFISAVFGAKRACRAVIIYILLGIFGIPVFSSFRAGIPALLTPPGGYIIGLIPFCAVSGFFCTRFGRRFAVMLPAMLVGLAMCYAVGTAQYMVYAKNSVIPALSVCVLPFILPDALKLILAAVLAKRFAGFTVDKSRQKMYNK